MNSSHILMTVSLSFGMITEVHSYALSVEKNRPFMYRHQSYQNSERGLSSQVIKVGNKLALLTTETKQQRIRVLLIHKDSFFEAVNQRYPSSLSRITKPSQKALAVSNLGPFFEDRCTLLYDERFGRLNAWHSQVTKDGKLALKVTPFQIRL